MKTKILRIYHDDFLTKYFEIKKIHSLLQRKFYWFKMLKNIEKYIQSCDVCQRVKIFKYCFYNELTSFFVLFRFWKKISINFIIELSFNYYENDIYDVIFVIINCYLKMTFYIFIKLTWSIEDFANVFFDKMFLIFLEIKEIVFNCDAFFTNDYWFALCYRIFIKRKLNIVFHFQIDEQTKRQNQTLKYYFRCYYNYKQDN